MHLIVSATVSPNEQLERTVTRRLQTASRGRSTAAVRRQAHRMNREPPKILIPRVDSRKNYLAGFWHWVQCLAQRDYARAIEALYWPDRKPWAPGDLEKRISTFFGGTTPWVAVIPNDRLIGVVNEAAECELRGSNAYGWLLAQIPVTNSDLDAKDDSIPLQGLATSFFVRPFRDSYALSIEMFHA